jgi:hypothetical protein
LLNQILPLRFQAWRNSTSTSYGFCSKIWRLIATMVVVSVAEIGAASTTITHHAHVGLPPKFQR